MKILTLLFTAAFILIALGVALAIGTKVNQDFSTASLVSESSTVLNESVAADTGAAATLLFTGASINKLITGCTHVYNATPSYLYGSDSYTCGADGTFTWLNETSPVVAVTVTYTQTWETWPADYNASHSSELGLANLSTWGSTISTVVVAVVILGLLTAGFGGFLFFKGKGV